MISVLYTMLVKKCCPKPYQGNPMNQKDTTRARMVHLTACNITMAIDLIENAISKSPAGQIGDGGSRHLLLERLEIQKARLLPGFAVNCAMVVSDAHGVIGSAQASALVHEAPDDEKVRIGEACVRAIGPLNPETYGAGVILHELREVFTEIVLQERESRHETLTWGGYQMDDDPLIDTSGFAKKGRGAE